jgi:hypothetical protein
MIGDCPKGDAFGIYDCDYRGLAGNPLTISATNSPPKVQTRFSTPHLLNFSPQLGQACTLKCNKLKVSFLLLLQKQVVFFQHSHCFFSLFREGV